MIGINFANSLSDSEQFHRLVGRVAWRYSVFRISGDCRQCEP